MNRPDFRQMDTTEMDKWEEIGRELKRLNNELAEICNKKLNEVPKTVWNEEYREVHRHLTQLRSDLEDRMFLEYDFAENSPDVEEIPLFIGGNLDLESAGSEDGGESA